jgi:hypothetical protein
MNIEFMCGLLANYNKELSEAETYREKGNVQLKHAKLILEKIENYHIQSIRGISCECGNKIFTHRHSNWIECITCNKIKII